MDKQNTHVSGFYKSLEIKGWHLNKNIQILDLYFLLLYKHVKCLNSLKWDTSPNS